MDCPRLEQPFRWLNRGEAPAERFPMLQEGKHGKSCYWVTVFYPEGISCTLSLTRRKNDAMPENSGNTILSDNYLINALTSDSFNESPSIQIRLTHLAIV